jgi:hypothetical protein
VFPQKFRAEFAEVDINVDDPRYGMWIESEDHQDYAAAYNNAWEEFLKSDPTKEQILRQGPKIMKRIYDVAVVLYKI